MDMNPILFGVLATLSVESVIVNLLLVAGFILNKKYNKKIRGGKYNG